MDNSNIRLERAEKLEELAQEIYLLFANIVVDDPSLCDLFRRLAEEERQHAMRVRLLASTRLRDPITGGTVAVSEGEIAEIFEYAENIRALGRAGEPIKANDARWLMVDLEDRFAKMHAQFLTADAHPELRRLFHSLAEQDEAHRRLLEEHTSATTNARNETTTRH